MSVRMYCGAFFPVYIDLHMCMYWRKLEDM